MNSDSHQTASNKFIDQDDLPVRNTFNKSCGSKTGGSFWRTEDDFNDRSPNYLSCHPQVNECSNNNYTSKFQSLRGNNSIDTPDKDQINSLYESAHTNNLNNSKTGMTHQEIDIFNEAIKNNEQDDSQIDNIVLKIMESKCYKISISYGTQEYQHSRKDLKYDEYVSGSNQFKLNERSCIGGGFSFFSRLFM